MKIIKTIACLWIFTAITTLPLSLLAQESENAIEHETGFYYTIQKGDTLWDLSQRFFDSPWQWPGLWNENDQIANPHLIYPGERIRLLHKRRIKNIAVKTPVKTDKKKAPYYTYSAIDSIGFIRKEPVSPSGYIFKSYDDKQMISTGDKVYIKPYGNALLIPGNKFTVYRTLKPLKDKETREYIGTQHYLGGILEITEIEPDFVTGTIIRSFRDMRVNDLLMPYISRQPKITLSESKKELNGKIIASEENTTVFGNDTIAFIDKGYNDGVVPGQQYSIYYQEKERLDPKSKKYTLLSKVNFGTLFVLRTEQTTSTVLITRSDKSITPGAKICGPLPRK
ncbi:MAG: hypothetical protein SRB1_02888 [Desulfobacteraceae bacterium Eth-SRB1]|nr:MAG: hypothetical protein SRB1_02888 [Desulfobacteraceae bacterium Eth-SRB1]